MKITYLFIALVLVVSEGKNTALAHGTAVFVDGKARKYLRDTGGITLTFTQSRSGRTTTVQTSAIGDYTCNLPLGSYCVSATAANGQSLPLAQQQHKCFSMSAKRGMRFDVMIENTE